MLYKDVFYIKQMVQEKLIVIYILINKYFPFFMDFLRLAKVSLLNDLI